ARVRLESAGWNSRIMEVNGPPVSAPASSGPPSDLGVRIRKPFAHAGTAFDLTATLRANAGFTILFGASGARKTTLLDCSAGPARPDDGRIVVGNRILFDSGEGLDVPPWKRGVGYVLQDLALFPHLTAEENVGFGLTHVGGAERRKRSLDMLQAFRVER